MDGPVSLDRSPSPSLLSSFGPQMHWGILAVLLSSRVFVSKCLAEGDWTIAEKRTSKTLEDTPRGEFHHRCLPPELSLLTFGTLQHAVSHSATDNVTSFLLSPLRLYLCPTVNPSIGTILLLAHGDTHLSMKEFILAANHSRGVLIKYRCANILMALRSSVGVIWSKTGSSNTHRNKMCSLLHNSCISTITEIDTKGKRRSINWIKSYDITQYALLYLVEVKVKHD